MRIKPLLTSIWYSSCPSIASLITFLIDDMGNFSVRSMDEMKQQQQQISNNIIIAPRNPSLSFYLKKYQTLRLPIIVVANPKLSLSNSYKFVKLAQMIKTSFHCHFGSGNISSCPLPNWKWFTIQMINGIGPQW